MNKTYAILATLVVAAMLLAACGTPATAVPATAVAATAEPATAEPATAEPPTAAPPINLTFATWDASPALKELVDDFNAANPGITVQMDLIPVANYSSVIQTRITGEEAPDVFGWYGGEDYKMAQNGWWGDLSNESWVPTLLPAAKSDVTYTDGKVYGYPMNSQATGVFYNKALFEQAGITADPKNWEEFLAICETLKAQGIDPLTVGGADGWPLTDVFTGLLNAFASVNDPTFGVDLYDGKATFAGSQYYPVAFQKYIELIEKGYFRTGIMGESFGDSMNDVATGSAAMNIGGSFVVGVMMQANPDAQIGYFPILNDEGKTGIDFKIDKVIGYSPNGKNVEAAKQFVNFIADPANTTKYLNSTQTLPAVSGLTLTLPDSILKLSDDLAENPLFSPPWGFWPGSTIQAVQTGVGGLFSGKTSEADIQSTLEEMDRTYIQDKDTTIRPNIPY